MKFTFLLTFSFLLAFSACDQSEPINKEGRQLEILTPIKKDTTTVPVPPTHDEYGELIIPEGQYRMPRRDTVDHGSGFVETPIGRTARISKQKMESLFKHSDWIVDEVHDIDSAMHVFPFPIFWLMQSQREPEINRDPQTIRIRNGIFGFTNPFITHNAASLGATYDERENKIVFNDPTYKTWTVVRLTDHFMELLRPYILGTKETPEIWGDWVYLRRIESGEHTSN